MVLKSTSIMLGIILLSLLIGVYVYPQMPDMMASHWNARGQVDGYVPKVWGLFLMPALSGVLLLVFGLIPEIDPLKANIEKFRAHYDRFVTIVIAFLFYIHLLTLLWNAGIVFNMARFLPPVLGILFYYSGILVENAKMNWFIGIRTPWTLSSESVWNRTHAIGGKLFKIAGGIAFSGIFFQSYALMFVLAPIILAGSYLIVYSYIEYRKNGNEKSA